MPWSVLSTGAAKVSPTSVTVESPAGKASDAVWSRHGNHVMRVA
jgi:hypothetical protein